MNLSPRLHGGIALVTGAGGSIGRASALRMGQEGAQVAVVDLRHDTAAQTLELLERHNVQAAAFQCDVADPSSVQAMVEACVA
ncbi:MAG: SDR family NAD(P)-dependent oxidoreductase, partial [Pseudonocardiaceae bacterium]